MLEPSRNKNSESRSSSEHLNGQPTPEGWLNKRYVAILAMLVGLGLILLDLGTGTLTGAMATPWKFLAYIPGILLSIWGMKQILTLQDDLTEGRTRKIWRLPNEGVAYISIMCVMFLAAVVGKSNPLMLVFAMMTGPFIINGSITFGMTRRISIQRKVPRRVMTNEPVNVSLIVTNRKWLMPSCVLTVHDQLESARERVQASVVYLFIMPRRSQTAQYLLKLANRGVYRFQTLTVLTRFPLGIVERGLSTTQTDVIYVYPQIGRLAQGWKQRLMGGEFLTRTTRSRNSVFNDEFHSIREYRNGDDYRTIHWPSSARRNELMVREFEESRDPHLTVVLDLNDANSTINTTSDELEYAISFATTIAVEHAQQCSVDRLTFVCIGEQSWSWQGNRTLALSELLERLAMAKHSLAKPAHQFLTEAEHYLDHPTSRILVITLREEELTTGLQKMTGHLQQMIADEQSDAAILVGNVQKTSYLQAAKVLSADQKSHNGLFNL